MLLLSLVMAGACGDAPEKLSQEEFNEIANALPDTLTPGDGEAIDAPDTQPPSDTDDDVLDTKADPKDEGRATSADDIPETEDIADDTSDVIDPCEAMDCKDGNLCIKNGCEDGACTDAAIPDCPEFEWTLLKVFGLDEQPPEGSLLSGPEGGQEEGVVMNSSCWLQSVEGAALWIPNPAKKHTAYGVRVSFTMTAGAQAQFWPAAAEKDGEIQAGVGLIVEEDEVQHLQMVDAGNPLTDDLDMEIPLTTWHTMEAVVDRGAGDIAFFVNGTFIKNWDLAAGAADGEYIRLKGLNVCWKELEVHRFKDICGNLTEDTGEACDEGDYPESKCEYNTKACQVCTIKCVLVPGEISFCGDKKVDTDNGEECDNGEADNDLCDDDCKEVWTEIGSDGLTVKPQGAIIDNTSGVAAHNQYNPVKGCWSISGDFKNALWIPLNLLTSGIEVANHSRYRVDVEVMNTATYASLAPKAKREITTMTWLTYESGIEFRYQTSATHTVVSLLETLDYATKIKGDWWLNKIEDTWLQVQVIVDNKNSRVRSWVNGEPVEWSTVDKTALLGGYIRLAGSLSGSCWKNLAVYRAVNICGNGVKDAGEACDDGNIESGDSCPMNCKCVPECDGKTCGNNDGCGGSCGSCDDGMKCNNGACSACQTLSCDGKDKAVCKVLPTGEVCAYIDQCFHTCQHVKLGVTVKTQTDCGGSCHAEASNWWKENCVDGESKAVCVNDIAHTCLSKISGQYFTLTACAAQGLACVTGTHPSGNPYAWCEETSCEPNCNAKNCGDDGCGGNCGAKKDPCNDGNKCTTDSCGADGVCVNVNLLMCCNDASDCPPTSPCVAVQCVDGWCDGSYAESDGCCDANILSNNFDTISPVNGWTFSNTLTGCQWHVYSGSPAYSIPNTLHYGRDDLSNYNCNKSTGSPKNKGNSGAATTPKFQVPNTQYVFLEFYAYLGIETNSDTDKFEIWVMPQDPPTTPVLLDNKVNLLNSGWAINKWEHFKIKLSDFQGQNVRIAFRFDTVDNKENSSSGVFI
jgi:hypothetical protein